MGEDSEKSTKEKSSSTIASSSSKHVEKDYATDSAVTTPSSATAATDGSSIVVQPGSIVVQPGEGAASIAARAGISVDELQRLNPDHMTNGYWFANPGDVVKVQ